MDADRVRSMEEHFETSRRGDAEGAHGIYHEDAVLEFPQSGERFEGVENFREWRSQFSIHEFRDGKIARETIYVAEGFEAPEWRAKWRAQP